MTSSLGRNVPDQLRRVQDETRLRVSSEAARLSEQLKRALHTTIHGSAQSPAQIAEHAGIGYSMLCDSANPSRINQLPMLRLPLVLESCDDLTFVDFLARLQHACVYRLPSVGAAGDAHQAAATMREFAELLEAGAVSMQDAVVSPEEFARVEREAHDVIRAVLEYVAHYRARVPRPLLEGV